MHRGWPTFPRTYIRENPDTTPEIPRTAGAPGSDREALQDAAGEGGVAAAGGGPIRVPAAGMNRLL